MSAEERARVTGATGDPGAQTSGVRVAATQPPRGRDQVTARGQGLVGAGGGGRLGGLLRIVRLDWVHVRRRGWAAVVVSLLVFLALPALPAFSDGSMVGAAHAGYAGAGFSLVSASWMSGRRYHLDGLCAALGVRRGEVVAARYLVLLAFLAVAVPVTFLATAVAAGAADPDPRAWLRWVVTSLFMVLAFSCLPPMWVSLGRSSMGAILLAWVACVVGCVLLLAGLSALVAWAGVSWSLLDPDSASFLTVVACASAVVGTAALVGSWRFTLRAYARQDL